MTLSLKRMIGGAVFALLVAGQQLSAQTPNDALEGLAAELNTTKTQLSSVQVSADTVCAPLLQANEAVRSAADAIAAVDESLAAPLQVDAATYDALDQLFATGLGISNEALRLSLDVQQLQGAASALTIKDGITTMLQLSTDIGEMADRIGEMADRILVMADNIDLMADRILQTQEIQSQNLVATTQNLLQTQQNMLTIVSVIETQTRTLQYSTLIEDGMALADQMDAVVLKPWTMKYELRDIAVAVQAYLAQVATVTSSMQSDAAAGTFYVDATTLAQMSDLSTMLTFVATAVDGYVIAINGLSPTTSTSTLSDSLGSMLQLSSDIGTMADRIGEMADTILVMADNIGLVADDIVGMQQLQSTNILAVQQSVMNVQLMVVALTVSRGL